MHLNWNTMEKKSYELTIGRKSKSVELLQSSDGRNAIAALYTDSLDGSLFDLTSTTPIYENRFIRLIQKSIKGCTLQSNSPDVLITDIYDKDGNPIYYKFLIRRSGFTSVYVNNVLVTNINDFFIFSNEKGTVRYEYSDGTSEEFEDERYPVFINSKDSSLRTILDIDNKFYNYTPDGNLFSIFVPSTNVSFKSKDITLIEMEQYDKNNPDYLKLYLKPFSVTKNINTEHGKYQLDYSADFPTIHIKRMEKEHAVVKDGYIYVKNNSIFDYDISIYLADPAGRVISEIDNRNNIFNSRNVFLKTGKIYLKDILSSIDLSSDNVILISYNYSHYENNNISIPGDIASDAEYISVGIMPTKISVDGRTANSELGIQYYVFDNLGNISYKNEVKNHSSFRRIVGYGFGEHGYSENGYSGIIEKNITEEDVRVGNIEFDEFGYSEYSYSFGPYGGKHLISYEDLLATMLISNSRIGYIELYKIKLKDLSNIPLVLNNRISVPKIGSQSIREVKDIKSSVFAVRLNNNRIPLFNAGIVDINVNNSTKSRLMKYKKDEMSTYYKADISKDKKEYLDIEYVEDDNKLSFYKSPGKLYKEDDLYNIYGIGRHSETEWSKVEYESKVIHEGFVYFKVSNFELDSFKSIGISYGDCYPEIRTI